jgi:stearoyl-CoA desaturase (delta-9 desaturase)
VAHLAVHLFVIVPFLALIAAAPFAWGWGLTWVDIALGVAWYTLTCLGVTVGSHRYFTHGAFKARRPLRIALAIAGSLAVQGPILHWVADHRRHHAFSDQEGDPHSPWLFGTSPLALARGFWHAHLGWILDRNLSNQERFARPAHDADMRWVHRTSRCGHSRRRASWAASSPGPWGAVTAFFWAGLVRILHHAGQSTRCHMIQERPFASATRPRTSGAAS